MSSRPRSHLTRLLHILSLAIVIDQLVSSLFMERPLPGDDPEWPYLLHVWSGTAGLQILLCFWIWVFLRDARETRFTEFFPWFSPRRLRAIFLEIDTTLGMLLKSRIPSFDLPAIAASVHGAGLMLATALAASGAAWCFLFAGTPYGRMVLMFHKLAGNLMWVYLIGHVTMGALHQLSGDPVISRMFWLKARRARSRVEAPAE
jgi:hypothetical protein